MAGDEHPLPDVELALGQFLRLAEQIGIGDVLLNDLVLILLPVFELIPHVLRVDTVIPDCPDDGDACASGASDGLYDPQRSFVVVGGVVLGEGLMVVQYEHEKAVINAIVIDAEVLVFVIVEVKQ